MLKLIAFLVCSWVATAQLTATIRGTCDNYMDVWVSYDGTEASYQDITSTLTGDYNGWSEEKYATLTGVTSATKLKIQCANAAGDDGQGGLIFSVEYQGAYYSTNGDTNNGDYYALASSTSGSTTTWSPPIGSTSGVDLTAAPYNAQWTWSCDWTSTTCAAGMQDVYVFDFADIPVDATIRGTCDNYMDVWVSYDGTEASYQDITSTLTGDYNNWSEEKFAILSGVTSATKLKIQCANAAGDDGQGGLIFSVEYQGAYYSTNGDTNNDGYYVLASSTSGSTTTWSPPIGSTTGVDLTASPYNAQWTWSCDWTSTTCAAGMQDVYVFDFADLTATTTVPPSAGPSDAPTIDPTNAPTDSPTTKSPTTANPTKATIDTESTTPCQAPRTVSACFFALYFVICIPF